MTTKMIVKLTGGLLLLPSIYLGAIIMESFENPKNPANNNGAGGIIAGLITAPAICAIITGKPTFVLLNAGLIAGFLVIPRFFPWSY